MKAWTTLGLFLLMCGALSLAACGGGGKKDNDGGGGSAKKEETKRLPVPEKFASMKPPKPIDDADMIAKGKKLFHGDANCFTCHGAEGKGDGEGGKELDPKPTDLTSADFQEAVTDQYIHWRLMEVQESKAYKNSGMLGYPNGTEEDRWALVAYVRSLGK
jgi:mono/diheme cytochrome c family protein